MNKQLRFIIFFLLFIVPGIRSSMAQAAFASEEELKLQATKLFDDDQFEEAYPLYSQLVSLYPKDANYNYRLGVCMLYASDDKEKPIPFLEYAAKKPEVEKEVFFYLARAYHLNYRFDDAIVQYLEYEKVASSAKAEKLQVDHQIEMCRNGKKLLRNITDLIVIDKKELSKADFYRAYDISDIGGKLLAKPDEDAFKTSLDKKKKEKSIIYLASNNNEVFFSSYGDDASHGKDIYIIRKLPNGEWSKPQTLGYPVNTEYDEDFPFLHPNGKVLYFCSKGHNSMGGYDIFKTTLNEETNTWNKPVNLDFPINTPDDDILYVTNEDEKEAFFSSARSSKTGKTAVYHINVERRPIDVAIIKGTVMKNRDNQALDVKITVKDLGDNSILGIYNSKAETGGYLINLPNGGKFMYTVEAAGFSTQSEVVIIPTQYVFKPLKQQISYETGTDKLQITNMFDEPADDESYLMALNFIKEKSKLDADVNAAAKIDAAADDAPNAVNNTAAADNTAAKNQDNSSAASTDGNGNPANGNNGATKTTVAKTSPGNKTGTNTSKSNTAATPLSNNDIVKIAYDDAKDAQKEAKDLHEQADIALNMANQKNDLAQSKTREATQLVADANNMTDNVKKQTAMDDANTARSEEEQLNRETVAAFNIAKKLGLKAAAKDEEADLSMQYAKDLETAVKSKNSAEAMAKLEEQEKKLEALSEKNGTAEPDNIVAGLKMDAAAKKRELDKVTQASADITQDMQDNETLMVSLQSDMEKTKKEDLKKGIQDQIAGLKADNEQNAKDLELNDQKVAKAQKEYAGIKNEMELVNSVVDQSKTGTNEAAAASVAGIDKTKLEQQVNEIKTTISTQTPVVKANTDNASADNATAAKNSTAAKINDAAATKNNDVAVTETTSTPDNTTSTVPKTSAADVTVNADNTAAANADATNSNSDKSNSPADNTPADNAAKTASVDDAKQYADQLAAADNITDAAAREDKKAEVYKAWSAAINTELARDKQEVKTEKDKAKKKALTESIAALEKELKNKQQDEKTAVASATKLKQQSTIADNTAPDATTKTTDNTTASDNSTTVATDAAATKNADTSTPEKAAAVFTTVNETYQDKLTEVNAIENPLERENAKAKVFKEWSAELSNLVAKQKKEFVITTDPQVKAALATQISEAQKQADATQDMATASATQAQALKEQSTLATNAGVTKTNTDNSAPPADNTTNNNTDNAATNTPAAVANETTSNADNTSAADNTSLKSTTETTDNTAAKTNDEAANATGNNLDNAAAGNANPAPTASQKLENVLAEAEKSEDPRERETLRKQAYTAYVAEEQQELKNKQSALKTGKDKTKKKALTEEIASIQNEIKEKQEVLDAIAMNAKALDEQAAVAAKTTDNTTTPAVTDNATASDNVTKTTVVAADGIVYTDAVATTRATEAAAAQKQADELNAQADGLKTQAAGKTKKTEKDALYAKAADLEQQADTKRMDAIGLSLDAGDAEYTANRNAVEQLALASVKNKSDEVAMAEMMSDESKMYFDKAQQSKVLLAGSTSEDSKLAVLEDAAANEKIALQKQQKALELYQKNNPGFVVKTNANPASQSNDAAATQTKSNVDNSTAATDNNTKSATTNTSDNVTSKSTDAAATQTKSNTDNSTAATDNNTTKSIAANTETSDNPASKSNEVAATQTKLNADNATSATDNNTTKSTVTNTDANDNTASKSNDVAATQTKSNADNTTAATDNTTAKTNDAGTIGTKLNPVTTDPQLTNTTSPSTAVLEPTEKFERTTQQVYSAARPIPVNEKLPEGLVFKVQIGAFRNPISPEAFSGMKPITAETTSQGFTRYTAGLFNKFATADKVKTEIRGLGYKDAFVVAFLNGKRISITEAIGMSGETGTAAAAAITAQTEAKNNPAANSTTAVSTPVKAAVNATDIAPSQNVTTVGGLFYTVQVGVYSQPITSAKLHNIQPLYTEKTANGYLRYNTGVYNNVARANEAKDVAVGAGVKDAFVTAYFQGKRVSLTEAQRLQDQGSGAFPGTATVNNLPSVNGVVKQNEPATVPVNTSKPVTEKATPLTQDVAPPAENTSPGTENTPVKTTEQMPVRTEEPATTQETPITTPVAEQPVTTTELKNTVEQNNTMPVDPGVVFKVQIGAFKDEVPLDIANRFLQIASKGIKNYRDENGLTIYTLGNFKTYEEASQLRADIATIVTDAFIVAYNEGKKISVDEAKSLLTK